MISRPLQNHMGQLGAVKHTLYCWRWWGGDRPAGARDCPMSANEGIFLLQRSSSAITQHLKKRMCL